VGEYELDRLDLILVITVSRRFGGQSFLASQIENVRRLRAMIAGRPIRLQVDGGSLLPTPAWRPPRG
jgi:ribulose-phosphate 3-epimerase